MTFFRSAHRDTATMKLKTVDFADTPEPPLEAYPSPWLSGQQIQAHHKLKKSALHTTRRGGTLLRPTYTPPPITTIRLRFLI